MKRKHLLAFFLSMTMIVGLLPAFVYAGKLDIEPDNKTVTVSDEKETPDSGDEGNKTGETVKIEIPPETANDSEPADNDELFKSYIEKKLYNTPSRLRKISLGSRLTGNSKSAYNLLIPQIKDVAEGNQTSTIFTVSIDAIKDICVTEADIGGPIINEGGYTKAAYDALKSKLDVNLTSINKALLADCSYELYWYDKSFIDPDGKKGAIMLSYPQIVASNDGTGWKMYYEDTTLTFRLKVAQGYAKNGADYETDPSQINRVNTAIYNAGEIVKEAKSKSDLKKLEFYRDEICNRVVYDHDAADDSSTPYGDPWQLISVFDDDPDTNVVCEGYSKAFKYLCDLTSFKNSDISCITVTGTMTSGSQGGGHMWNIVKMDDGKYYHVDVTNCDSTSIGYPDYLFLKGYTSGSPSSVFKFACKNSLVSYKYDDDMATYFPDEINISSTNYKSYIASGDYGTNLTWILENNGVLKITGSGDMYDYALANVPWHNYRDSIKSVVFDGEITSIGSYAFAECPAFTAFDIPDSVVKIGMSAFDSCSNLKSVTIPGGVKNIGNSAFKKCTSLGSITLPDGITTIGTSAFNYCTSLKSVTIPGSIDHISNGAFSNCTSLTAVTIPESVASVGNAAFNYCTALKTVDYGSDRVAWENINFGTSNEPLLNAKINFAYFSVIVDARDGQRADADKYKAKQGDTITITTYTSGGYERDYITVNGKAQTDTTFTMPAEDVTVVVFFKKRPLKVTVNAGEGGKAFVDKETYYVGDTVKITATPDSCYDLDTIKVGNTVLNGTEFTMGAWNTTVDVTFKLRSHSLTPVSGKAPTCTEAGYEPYYECSGCGRMFSDEHGNYEISAPVSIPATGHDMITYPAVAATKKAAGNIEYYKCKICGKRFSDKAGTHEITLADTVIPKIPHDLTKVEAKPATCTAEGNIEYYICKDEECGCNKIYKDAAGKQEISMAKTVIAALGHDIGDVEAKEPTCEEAGYESHFKCRQCGKLFSDKYGQHEISEPAAIPATGHKTVYHQGERATCTKAGHDNYYECSVCHKLFSDKAGTNEITEVKTYPATGHNMDTHEAKAATKQSEGNIKYYVCRNCRKIFSDEEGTHEITLADTIIPKLKHDLTHVKAKAATCTEDGNIEYYICKDEECGCGNIYSDAKGENKIKMADTVIAATGHNIVEVHAKAPTCEKDGYESHFKCSHCGTLYSDKDGKNKIDEVTVIPKLGHEWEKEGVVTKEPTCEKKGVRTFKCIHDGCKKTKTEDIDPLGHDPKLVKAKKATRDKDGNKAYYVCSRCGKKFWDKACKKPADDKDIVIPAIGAAKLGEKATVGGLEYQVTNASTNGTGTVTLTGVAKQAENVSIPGTVVIKETTYMVTVIKAEAFSKNTTVKSVVICENVLTIDSKAFYGCSSLTSVTGGDNLVTIGTSAFAGCKKLKTFKITSQVLAKIGATAFSGDKKLKTIYIKNTTKLTKSGVKKSLKGSKVKTVKVKKSKVKAYKKIFKKKNSGRTVKVKK